MEQKDTRRSLNCYIIEAALEYFISIMVSGAYLARITSALGFSDGLTGILSSFVSMGCLFQLGSMWAFGKTRRVKSKIIRMHIVNQTMYGCMYLIPMLTVPAWLRTTLFLACFCGSNVLINLISPCKVNWLRGMVPDNQRGIFTAKLEIVSLLGGMVFTYALGALIDGMEAGGRRSLTFAAGGIIVFVLTILHTLSLVPVEERDVSKQDGSFSIVDLLKNKMVLRIMVVRVLWSVASSVSTSFYGAYQIKELGFSMTFISILTIGNALIRVAASPYMGRYADSHSNSRVSVICFLLLTAAFGVNIFTVPSNGRVLYAVYFAIYGIAMAGVGGAMTNLIYDVVRGDRRMALAASSAISGVFGFAATCLMSIAVSKIQAAGNRLLGIPMYPTQLGSAIAALLCAMLALYLRFSVIPAEDRAKSEETR